MADSGDILAVGALEQARRVRDGEISARELVEASLEAIERLNPTLNAFIALSPERALDEADRIRPGDPRPFCGVPVGIKDLMSATQGLPSTHGSSAFGDWVAEHDAAHIRRLREAGAIVVGKTNSPELGLRPVTENARYGATRNPWDTMLSSGGSSGGSAAAVASGMVALADGSDLGGSIRIPASCCGLVGLKPSMGRVSMAPDFGDITAGMVGDLVLSRTVADTAAALDVMAGYEPGDRRSPAVAGGSFATAAASTPGRLRIRLCVEAPLGVAMDDEPRAAVLDAAQALRELGHRVDEIAAFPGDHTAFGAAWGTFMTGTAQHLVRVVERLHGRAADPELLEPASRAWLIDSAPVTLIDYLEAGERLWAFGRGVIAGWADDEVLLTPTLTRLPAPVGGIRSQAGVTDDASRFSALVRVWNATGQPAISLPLGRSGAGVPVGVQLVAAPGRDDLLLGLASQLEQVMGWPLTA